MNALLMPISFNITKNRSTKTRILESVEGNLHGGKCSLKITFADDLLRASTLTSTFNESIFVSSTLTATSVC